MISIGSLRFGVSRALTGSGQGRPAGRLNLEGMRAGGVGLRRGRAGTACASGRPGGVPGRPLGRLGCLGPATARMAEPRLGTAPAGRG